MSNDNRNMILAVVLSALVLFGWSAISEYYFPTANPPATKTENGKQVPVAQPQASAVSSTPVANRNRDLVLRETAGERIRIETPLLRGSLSLRGARIDDLVLLRHREGIGANSPPVRLFSPVGTREAYYAGFGWSGPQSTNDLRPKADTLWTASGGPALTPTTPVTLTWNNGRGQIYQIVLRVDDGYLFTAEQNLINRGQPLMMATSALVNRTGRGHDVDSWVSQVGPVGVFNGTANYDTDYSTLGETQGHVVSQDSRGGWLGFTDKYWLAAVIPSQQANVATSFRQLDAAGNVFQADYTGQMREIGANQRMTATSHLFAGAKEIHYLNLYRDNLGTDLGRAIDWGWFDFIMKPIFALLTWLFSVIGNFGVAIICLTIIVRILLFPLAQKQFSSMAKMKVLQPKIKALQERYKDDKPRMQQEMMKMYKEEQVNPMAGCLPIFLQIPVFYALYKVLMVAVEMRHQPFTLWIHDLTAPDPLTPVNLFGLLPFTPPSILAIGILPILVGVTMWLQQKMNTAPMDPMQQKIFAWMPWILVVIMAPFAAGFQVYWVTNNLISILQIWFLNRKLGVNTPPPAVALAAPAAPTGPTQSRQVTRAQSNKRRSRPPRKK
ncbi:MAG TPA: membrane protein insertase YidC [Allosphingosinicella sp.]|nr:membrane protein insertase YidC [Allosphingosinicella sp.]